MAGGVVSLGHLLQAFQAGEGGGIVFGALENNADEAADVIAQLFGADVNARASNDARLFHLFDAHMNSTRADAELFGQFGIGGTGVGHERIENAAVQIVDLIIFHIFFL